MWVLSVTPCRYYSYLLRTVDDEGVLLYTKVHTCITPCMCVFNECLVFIITYIVLLHTCMHIYNLYIKLKLNIYKYYYYII